MVIVKWFVFPVEGGLELVIDSTDELVLDEAMAAVAAEFPGFLIQTEWVMDSGDVILLVPAPVEVPQQLTAVPQQQSRSTAEEKSRAAHPAGKGRKQV